MGSFYMFFSPYVSMGQGVSTQLSFTKREISCIISYTKIQMNTTKTNVQKSYKLFERVIESSIHITFNYFVHYSTTCKGVELKTQRKHHQYHSHLLHHQRDCFYLLSIEYMPNVLKIFSHIILTKTHEVFNTQFADKDREIEII